MCAFANTAGIAVLNKKILKKGIEFIDKPVMNHPVSKISGKNFSFYRFVYNKCDAATKLIVAFVNIINKFKNILL